MKRFPEKLRQARKQKELNQTELAEMLGITQRTVTNYERGCATPHASMIRKLAKALDVTVEYLTNDEIDDPESGRIAEEQIEIAREKFGSKGAKEATELLKRSAALFAGGDLDQEAKDAFFQALMTTYVISKNEARVKFTPKSKRKQPDQAED